MSLEVNIARNSTGVSVVPECIKGDPFNAVQAAGIW
jgi:hypothetical protein